MKLGLDLHGVIDAYPKKFVSMAKLVLHSHGEVWICTGSKDTPELHEELRSYNDGHIWWTKIFSVSDHLIAQGVPYTLTTHGIRVDEELWDKVKGEWAEREKIDLHIDDSPVYGKYFPQGVYLKFNARDHR